MQIKIALNNVKDNDVANKSSKKLDLLTFVRYLKN